MTDYREQAIRDVAGALGRSPGRLSYAVKNGGLGVKAKELIYAVAQRELVLELEAELKQWRGCGWAQCDGNTSDPCDVLGELSLRSITREAQLQQKEGGDHGTENR